MRKKSKLKVDLSRNHPRSSRRRIRRGTRVVEILGRLPRKESLPSATGKPSRKRKSDRRKITRTSRSEKRSKPRANRNKLKKRRRK